MVREERLHCVVLDEASQMSIPEAIMATLPLEPDGRLIVRHELKQPSLNEQPFTPETTYDMIRKYKITNFAAGAGTVLTLFTATDPSNVRQPITVAPLRSKV